MSRVYSTITLYIITRDLYSHILSFFANVRRDAPTTLRLLRHHAHVARDISEARTLLVVIGVYTKTGTSSL